MKTNANIPQTNSTDALIKRIKSNNNFMSIRQFMDFCLNDSQHGYYATKKAVLGRQGDFITSPEISQIFGELIGLWFLNHWEGCSNPTPVALLELGPGRGLLMRDILRAAKIRPHFLDSVEIHMVEINPHLKERQKETCAPHEIHYHNTLESALTAIGNQKTYLIANEFFDALAIDQYIFQDKQWKVRGVSYDNNKQEITFSARPLDLSKSTVTFPMKPKDGTIMESAPSTENLFRKLAKHITKTGGAGLIIDYGYDQFGYGDTLQAIKDHKKVSVLDHIGEADLTTHVNFATLKRIGQLLEKEGLETLTTTQGNFLRDLGIDIRTELLGKACKTLSERDSLFASTNRLVDEKQMGTLFKCLQIWTRTQNN